MRNSEESCRRIVEKQRFADFCCISQIDLKIEIEYIHISHWPLVEETPALRLRCKHWSHIWGGMGGLNHRSGTFMPSQLRRTTVLLHFAIDPKDRKVEDIIVYTHFLLACSVTDSNFWGWGVHPTAPSHKSHETWLLLHFAFWTMNRINKRTAFKRVPAPNFGGYVGCETPSLL